MKTYRIALVDDNLTDQQRVLRHVVTIPFLVLSGVYDDALTAIQTLNTEPVDLLLLDLGLPDLSGFSLLRELIEPPAVIMTTSSLADSLEAYEVGVVDYLVKPIGFDRFLRAVNKAVVYMQGRASPNPVYIQLKQRYEVLRVPVNTIIHLEASGAYTKVYLTAGKRQVVNHLLADLADQLAPHGFIRIHRSYVVALARITALSSRELTIGLQKIPIGRNFQDSLRQALLDSEFV